jgi:hypothetical protein
VGRREDRVGRNSPCPCGSGVKFKKCCLNKGESREQTYKTIPPAVLVTLREMEEKERMRQQKFGEVRPLVHGDLGGRKLVVLGDRIYHSEKWKTFPDFLAGYPKSVLGGEWGKAELAKPLEERHQVMKWYDAMCRFQGKQQRAPDGLIGVLPNGSMKAYMLLAYDLFTLRNHGAMQKAVIERLKNKDQFQGARHELFAAATCIRAGYDIQYEDEADCTKKHVEFIATHRVMKQRIAVEAKSRRRPGILGHPGSRKPDEEVRASIDNLLTDALNKPVTDPYVIFFDLNLPPSAGSIPLKPWIEEIEESLRRITGGGVGGPAPFNLIILTSEPHHYTGDSEPAPRGEIYSEFGRNPRTAAAHPDAIMAIHEAAKKFGAIPNSFEEIS